MTTSEPLTRSSHREHWGDVVLREAIASVSGIALREEVFRTRIQASILRRLTKRFGDISGESVRHLETIDDPQLLEELLICSVTCPSLEAFQEELNLVVVIHSK